MILILGVLLLILPGASKRESESAISEERLEEMLGKIAGVGEVEVLLSDNGAMIVCRGANDPKVRLDIIRAVASYTGFGSDKIAVLKMTEKR
ncbi:MAG: hypothetical protein IK095_06145 [Oscillospiraceae bacterium]|nr:hypothetical protein [Oscillospiraceae bacterium]